MLLQICQDPKSDPGRRGPRCLTEDGIEGGRAWAIATMTGCALVNPAKGPCAVNPTPRGKFPRLCPTFHDFGLELFDVIQVTGPSLHTDCGVCKCARLAFPLPFFFRSHTDNLLYAIGPSFSTIVETERKALEGSRNRQEVDRDIWEERGACHNLACDFMFKSSEYPPDSSQCWSA